MWNIFIPTGTGVLSIRYPPQWWPLSMTTQPWPRATMVTFGGTPRGCPSFSSPRCLPSSPALHHQCCFSWLVEPCSCHQEDWRRHPAVPTDSSWLLRRFSAWWLCATSLGCPRRSRLYVAALAARWAGYPAAQPTKHTAMSTTVPPRRCRHPEFYSSLPSLLGSDSTIFSRHSTLSRQQASVYLESRALPAAAPRGHLLRDEV